MSEPECAVKRNDGESVRRLLSEEWWYYSIEMREGHFTPGKQYPNLALTRELLSRVDVAGASCLDIGTMEGVIPVLLSRRGAREVVAIDAFDLSAKIALVKSVYGVEFDYYGNVGFENALDFLTKRAELRAFGTEAVGFGFDVVVLSGVLYHVFSPLHVLGFARSCLREGGLLVLETAASAEPEYLMRYNFTGVDYIYDWTDTWYLSIPLLDHFCRMCALQPLDCLHLAPDLPAHPSIVRTAVACRAVAGSMALPSEKLMEPSVRNFDFRTVVRLDAAPGARREMSYASPAALHVHEALGSCDLLATVDSTPPYSVRPEQTMLRLDARV